MAAIPTASDGALSADLSADLSDGPAPAMLHDRSGWARSGLRGPATARWCDTLGLPFPAQVNRIVRDRGLRIARLGETELLIVPEHEQTPLPRPDHPVADVHDGYRDETWAWFRIEGHGATTALAAMTSADLRPKMAPPGCVVQTRLAGLDAVLLIDGTAAGRALDIFIDIASVDYFLGALGDRCPALRRHGVTPETAREP